MTIRSIALVLILLGLAAPLVTAQAQVLTPIAPAAREPLRVDGPHVWVRGDRAEVVRIKDGPGGPALDRESLSREDLFARPLACTVDDAGRTRFDVILRAQHPIAPAILPQPARLLATSDLEGNFDVLVRILRSQGVVDDRLAWTYGEGHLLVLGDSVDRGDNVTQLLWLLYKLDGEARAAGGAVHVVLGNHETMLMRGDARYIAPKYRRLLEETRLPIEEFFSAQSEIGRWLRTKHSLVRIGDTLFVHAGIGPRFLEKRLSIDAANELVRAHLGVKKPEGDGALAQGNDGPLWYRGLVVANGDIPKADAAHVARVLEHYQARRVVVGHTIVERIRTDYDGRVVHLDLKHPASKSEGPALALLFEQGAPFVVGDDGSRTPLD